MPKKSERTPTGLNLTPELPEVVSRDFNLFYTPQKEPEIAGLKEFTSALDNFVNNGGTKAVLMSEEETKKINTAQAQQDYLNNQLGFKEAIKAGKIDATANPYYLEKYKELTLNSFASEFASKAGQAYADQNVLNDITPNSFDNFYKNEMAKFIKEKGLSTFQPLDLEKGFFKETSNFRNTLENNHRQQQLKLFKEKFTEKVSDKVGSIVEKFKNIDNDALAGTQSGYDKFNLMADSMNVLVKELIDVNGNGRETIDTVMEGLKKWATTTDDIEFAKKVISELPSKLLAGTDSFENIGRVKRLRQETLDVLIDKSAERTGKYNQLSKGLREKQQLDTYNFLAEKVKENPNFNVTAWYSDPKRTGSEKQGASDFLKDLQFDRGNTDNPDVIKKLDKLINIERNYLEAYQYARDEFQNGNLRLETKDKYIGQYIADAQSGKYDEALQNKFIKDDLQRISKIISSEKGGDSAVEAVEFTNFVTYKLREWHKHNSSNFKNQYEYDKALEAEYTSIVKNLKSLGRYSSLFGKFDDSYRFGSGTINENISNAIQQQKQIEEAQKQKLKEQNKNLKDDEIQKLYDAKQAEKKQYYSSPEKAKKAQEVINEKKALEVMKNPLTGIVRDAFDPKFNKDKK